MKAPRLDRSAQISYLPSATLADADDTALVHGLLDDDPRATREAWRRFGPMVRRILVRTLGPESELEDLSQEVFITFFDRVKTIRDPRTLTAFIMSITAFKVRHHLRWRWLRRWLVLPGQVEKLDLRSFQPNAEAREALSRFFKVLDRVNATDRTAFTLRFVEEMELLEPVEHRLGDVVRDLLLPQLVGQLRTGLHLPAEVVHQDVLRALLQLLDPAHGRRLERRSPLGVAIRDCVVAAPHDVLRPAQSRSTTAAIA